MFCSGVIQVEQEVVSWVVHVEKERGNGVSVAAGAAGDDADLVDPADPVLRVRQHLEGRPRARGRHGRGSSPTRGTGGGGVGRTARGMRGTG